MGRGLPTSALPILICVQITACSSEGSIADDERVHDAFDRVSAGPAVLDPGSTGGVTWVDYDADGDLDALVGEFGTTFNARFFYMRNDGTTELPSWVEVSDNRSGTIFAERVFQANVAPELHDLDGDGDFDLFVGELRKREIPTSVGLFGAMMNVELVNQGPVTLVLEKGPPTEGGDR